MSWVELAKRQSGVVSRRQLADCGVGRVELAVLRSSGVLEPQTTRTLRLTGVEWDWEARVWIVLLDGGPEAVAFRRTAARLWELDGLDRDDTVELAVPRASGVRRPFVHRVASLPVTEVTQIRSIPLTSVARTLADLGEVCTADVVERAMESALRRRAVTVAALEQMAEIHGAKGRGGVPVLRGVLRRRPPGAKPTESDAETLMVQLVRLLALPAPVRQFEIETPTGRLRVDLAWPERLLLVEVDGAATHTGAAALGRDLRRQNRIVGKGWTLLRFTWEDIVFHPDEVAAVLLETWATCAVVARRR